MRLPQCLSDITTHSCGEACLFSVIRVELTFRLAVDSSIG